MRLSQAIDMIVDMKAEQPKKNWILSHCYENDSEGKPFLSLVLRPFKGEFVIHTYNHQTDGYFWGTYCATEKSGRAVFATRLKEKTQQREAY